MQPSSTPTLSAFATGRMIAPLWTAPNGRVFYPIAGGAPDDGGGSGSAGGEQQQTGSQSGDQSTGQQGSQQGQQQDSGKTYTAAELSAAIESRVGELTRKHERALQEAKDDAGRSDTQRIEAERDRANERAEASVQKAAPRVAAALAQVQAIAEGGRPDRAAAIVKQADLDGVAKFDGDDWTVDAEKVTAAIAKVLDEYPEWKAETGSGDSGDGKSKGGQSGGQQQSASGGDLGGGTGGGDVTADQFKAMNMAKRSELRASDPETYRRLADAEIAAAGKR